MYWNALDRDQQQVAAQLRASISKNHAGWRSAFDRPGLFVSTQSRSHREFHNVYPLAAGRGAVLGKLFERSYIDADAGSLPSAVTFSDSTSAEIIADRGDTLRDRYWGEYVAFLFDQDSKQGCVLRDPTGGSPCEHISIDGVSIYFAPLADVELIAPLDLAFNPHYFLSSVVVGNLFSGETAYRNIETVLPGQRI